VIASAALLLLLSSRAESHSLAEEHRDSGAHV
jgi:hypothetical protein